MSELSDSSGDVPSFFVTGAAGCIGRELVGQLSTKACVTGMDLLPKPLGLGTTAWVEGDILDESRYTSCLEGVDTVFHLAAKVHSVPGTPNEADQFWKVNLEGTRKLIKVAEKERVRKFVHVSTVAVHSSTGGDLKDAYIESKRAAEKVVLEFQNRMDVIIVRPATVYGPYDRGNFFKLINWIDRGFPPIIGSGTNRKSVVFVRTLADALVFLSKQGENGRAYVVTDGRDPTMEEIVQTISRALGVKNRWPAISPSMARGMAVVNEWLSEKLRFPRLLGCEMVEKLIEETIFDPTPLLSLGFSTRYSFKEGVGEAVRWYRSSGHRL